MAAEVISIPQRAREFRAYQAGWLESAAVLAETVADGFKDETDPRSVSCRLDLVRAQELLDSVAKRLSPILPAPDEQPRGAA